MPEITSPLTLQLCVADQPAPYGRGCDVFATREDDEDVGLSQNDQRFLQKMAEGTRVTDEGNVELPLPLKDDNRKLPNNAGAVYQRTKSTLNKLKEGKDGKLEKCIETMRTNIDKKCVEMVPDDESQPAPGTCWYVPIFCVSQMTKNKIRLVFDASAQYQKICLNDVLL